MPARSCASASQADEGSKGSSKNRVRGQLQVVVKMSWKIRFTFRKKMQTPTDSHGCPLLHHAKPPPHTNVVKGQANRQPQLHLLSNPLWVQLHCWSLRCMAGHRPRKPGEVQAKKMGGLEKNWNGLIVLLVYEMLKHFLVQMNLRCGGLTWLRIKRLQQFNSNMCCSSFLSAFAADTPKTTKKETPSFWRKPFSKAGWHDHQSSKDQTHVQSRGFYHVCISPRSSQNASQTKRAVGSTPAQRSVWSDTGPIFGRSHQELSRMGNNSSVPFLVPVGFGLLPIQPGAYSLSSAFCSSSKTKWAREA